MADVFNIAGRIHSTSQEEVVTTTNEILDATQEKKQSEVNSEVSEELALHNNRLNALTDENFVTVQATQSTTDADIPTLINATGDGEQTDTIYRVGFWDGSAFDGTKYSEYAWNGSAYVQLNVRTALGEIFDISEYNASGGSPATYANLTAALAGVPIDAKHGGMTVKFIQRTGSGTTEDPYVDTYVQYRLMATEWTTTVAQWQGVDVIPTPGSKNFVESGGVYNELSVINSKTENINKINTLEQEESIEIKTDDDSYIAHIDNDGVHSKDLLIQPIKNSTPTSVSGKLVNLENRIENNEDKLEEISNGASLSVEDNVEFKKNDETELYVKINKNGLYAKGYYDLEGNEISSPLGNVLYGKKYVAIGDSFTEGAYSGSTEQYTYTDGPYAGLNKVYPRMVALRNRMTLEMMAIAGTTLAYDSESSAPARTTYAFSNTRYQSIPTDADYITIWYGINDCASTEEMAIPVGTINDNVNTTFYGAWNIVLSWIVSNVPKAKVGIVVSNAIGSSTRGAEYRQAIRDVAEKYGFAVLDIEGDKEVPYFLFQYEKTYVAQAVKTSRDQLHSVVWGTNNHPNVVCHEFVSTLVENFLRRI